MNNNCVASANQNWAFEAQLEARLDESECMVSVLYQESLYQECEKNTRHIGISKIYCGIKFNIVLYYLCCLINMCV